jgi:asparagine N-glycosylation enzyme membrane subunit Stt3
MAEITSPRTASSTTTTTPAPRDSRAGLRRYLWWALAAVALLLGYADLWRGGETIAPLLLVVGYCVLVPLAILRR